MFEKTIELKLKNPHPAQQKILQEAKRFNVLKCGRRFGKTLLSEELAIQPALDGYPVGYWNATYKDVSKVWDQIKFICYGITKRKDEQLKQIHLITGGQIDFWSMEDPNSGRGFAYKRAIMDECEKARNFEEAWKQAIRPTLTDYEGDAWFLSTPKFGKSYFKEITKNKERAGFENWNSWTMTSYDNPFLKKSEIDEARLQYDDLTFKCEYLAEDVDLVGKPFAYCFDLQKHIADFEMDNSQELFISFDFNVDPITALASQYVDGRIRIIKEFRLSNSNIYELCERIKVEYPNALILVSGDATGHNRSALTSGTMNYYTVIQSELNLSDGQMKQPSINPAVKDSRVLLNSILQNYPPAIHSDCKYLIEDLKYVEVTDDGDINKTKDKHQSHLLDCFRYLLNTFYSHLLNMNVENF